MDKQEAAAYREADGLYQAWLSRQQPNGHGIAATPGILWRAFKAGFDFGREPWPASVLEAMARAHDEEEAAQKGEPSPWDIEPRDPTWEAERLAAMRQAVKAIGRAT